MKNIIITTLFLYASYANAQVIIGNTDGGPETNKSSVLLEFARSDNKGIVVPTVREKTSITPTQGTILLDATDASKARVKFYNGKNTSVDNGWVDLSGQDGVVTSFLADQPVTTTAVSDKGKAIIGASSSTADGVLVLESNTKAMVLPIVTDYTNIKNPAPGMMAFLKPSTGSAHYRLIVFNGTKWSFWKP